MKRRKVASQTMLLLFFLLRIFFLKSACLEASKNVNTNEVRSVIIWAQEVIADDTSI